MSPRPVSWMCLLACLTVTGCDPSASPPADKAAKADDTKTPEAATPTPPAAAPTPAQQPPVAADPATPSLQSGPQWQCDQPLYDFGEVWAGARVTHDFHFKNAGDALLRILEAKPRCSCSVAENYTREVPPGQSGVIPFVLQTKNKHGAVNEYLTIKTNTPSRQDMMITLRGVVRTVCQTEVTYDAKYEIERAAGLVTGPLNKKGKAYFGKIAADDKLHRIIKLINTSGQPLSLDLQPLPANSKYQIDFKETVPGEEFELTVIGLTPFPVGRWNMPIRFRTNVVEAPSFALYASAYVPPRVELIPGKIVVNQQLVKTKERQIRINNNGSTPVNIISIATTDPSYVIVIKPPNPKKPQQQVVSITFPGEGYEPPMYGEWIEIKTDDPEFGEFRIPLHPKLNMRLTPRPADKPLVWHPVDLSGSGG